MFERPLRLTILALALALVALHLYVKRPLDQDLMQQLTERFMSRDQYVGSPAPDFQITCLDGSSLSLADSLGTNVVVINFFTTWCGPCQEEMAELQHFADEMRDRPVKFIAISVGEETDTVEGFVAREKLHFRVAADRQRDVASRYCIQSYPATVVIEPNGTIMLYEVGAIANAEASLKPLVSTFADTASRRRGPAFDVEAYRHRAPARLTPPSRPPTSKTGAHARADRAGGTNSATRIDTNSPAAPTKEAP